MAWPHRLFMDGAASADINSESISMDDYMSDTDTAAAPEVDSPAEEASETKTSLLPVAFFQGKELEPGSECKVRIESVEDDQVQVSYVPHTEEESGETVADLPESPPDSDMMA